MRRLPIFAVFAVGMFLAMRKITDRAGPAMWERCSEMCDRLLANMPESFPPNRIMADLEALKEQTARIVEVLEEREHQHDAERGKHEKRLGNDRPKSAHSTRRRSSTP